VLVDPIVGRSPLRLRVDPALQGRLLALAAGRPLVIDYYASVYRGVTVGDLIVRFGDPRPEPRYQELEPVEGITVLAERSLVDLLSGATLREAGLPKLRHMAISLETPERWIDFLQHHPAPRG
jgi:hypothetical protein